MVYCKRRPHGSGSWPPRCPPCRPSSSRGNLLLTICYLDRRLRHQMENMWRVASWVSHTSFMRWGFDGLLQVQFRGNMYPVSIRNFTFNVDGIHVVEAMHMNQYPLYACYLVLLAVCLVFMALYYVSLKFIKQKSSQDW
ncbi:ATP-binding cassette sub-family G member 8-like [Notothenia coriiceps]|uniref:ATP-binding cassette sub-family G member 8-like n=1 Tax=Notothenia coriiceps TaxID=8208 RepID=A0A6I9MM26_9TELE|nr:PREDICTED: ATP-binding cassette sub-family G member 8-like [Notothenia coriiceps]